MAGMTGLEPAISCVTGRRELQLLHIPERGKRLVAGTGFAPDLLVMSQTYCPSLLARDNILPNKWCKWEELNFHAPRSGSFTDYWTKPIRPSLAKWRRIDDSNAQP